MNTRFYKTVSAIAICLHTWALLGAERTASPNSNDHSAGFGSLIDPSKQSDSIISTNKKQKSADAAIPIERTENGRRMMPAPVGGSPNVPNATTAPSEVSCNLFENPEFSTVMSALSSLKNSIQTVQNCKDNESNKSLNEIEKSRSQIEVSLKEIHEYFEKARQGEKVTPQIAEKISATISQTVSSSAQITGIFGRNFECTKGKSPDVALAVNNLLNGLTPFAAMAASAAGATVSSSAAFPLLAGTAITSTISSINDILTADEINVDDPVVRRAILENTCQLLKLETKKQIFMNETNENDHLITGISDTSSQLNEEARRLYGLKIEALGVLNEKFLNINNLLDTTAQLQRDSAKFYDFFTNSPSDKEKCLLVGDLFNSKIPDRTFDNLKSAFALFSETNDSYTLIKMGTDRQTNINTTKSTELSTYRNRNNNKITPAETQACAQGLQVWIQAIKEAANLSADILNSEKNMLDSQIQANKEYMNFVESSKQIKFRANVARGIITAVDEIKKSNTFNKTELYSDLEKVRNTLFYKHKNRYNWSIDSPITAWLNFHIKEHKRLLENFYYGFHKIAMMSSPYSQDQIKLDTNLAALKPQYFDHPSSTMTSAQVCTELKNVQAKWNESEAYLVAAKRFCTMISDHINITNENDDAVLKICKGTPMMTNQAIAGISRPNILFYGVRFNSADQAAEIDSLISDLQKPKSNIVKYLNILQEKLELFNCK
jgi:hypothetical protein